MYFVICPNLVNPQAESALITPGLKVQNWTVTSREHLARLAFGLNFELVSSKVQVFILVAAFVPSYQLIFQFHFCHHPPGHHNFKGPVG
jgi:hypothetical protein